MTRVMLVLGLALLCWPLGVGADDTILSCGPEPSADLHCDSSVGKSEQIITNQLDASVALLGALLLTTQQLQELKAALEQDNVRLRVTLIDHPCLVKMAAAMKAMDPYLVGPIDRATRAGWERVLDHWNLVSSECWQEKP